MDSLAEVILQGRYPGCAAVCAVPLLGGRGVPGDPGMGAFPPGKGTAVTGKEQQHLPLL